MKNEDLYYKIQQKCTVRKELLKFALSVTQWDRPRTFLCKQCPPEIYGKDDLFRSLRSILRSDGLGIFIFKMPAETYYSLHIDDNIRISSFNMLLNDHSDSVSFFTTSKIQYTQFDIAELKYEQDHLYLFNTQRQHAVVNNGDDRYVLSMHSNLSYDDSLKFLKENNF